MEKADVNALKLRLLQNKTKTASNSNASDVVTYVTTSKKVTHIKDPQTDLDAHVHQEVDVFTPVFSTSELLNFSSPLLKLIAEYVSKDRSLTMRMLLNDKTEQIDISRIKPDFLDCNNFPITAAHLLISESGDAKFNIITGKSTEASIKEKSDIEELLRRFDTSYRLCTGLPAALPEIQYYTGRYQVFLEYPYPHARSKDCFQWHQPSNRTAIRERLGAGNYRCPACKRYFNKIAQCCRDKIAKDDKKLSCVSKSKRSKPVLNKKRKSVSPQQGIAKEKKHNDKKRTMKFEHKYAQTDEMDSDNILLSQCENVSNLFTDINDRNAKAALLASACSIQALYDSSDDVIELTAGNFNHKVVNSDEIWFVEFYAPWCGHCKSLAPEWKKAAKALKGIVKVGAVDMDVHGSVGGPYNIRGFPTIKVFGANKNSPQDYNGARSAQGIVDEALKVAQRVVKDRLSGRGGSSGGGSGGSGSDDVVELTDANFEKEVLNAKEPVLVEFFAPWCGHCQQLAPEWKKAAAELKGKVKVAALDATVHTVVAGRFQVQGYPTIKFFRAGVKDFGSAEDFQGGRTASDIVQFALQLHAASVEPPEIMELTSNKVLTDNCNEKPLCVVSFLPDILDTQASGRNAYLNILKELGDKYKSKLWGWVWTASNTHSKLETALGIGGFGYPAMAVVNVRKKVYVGLRGSFSKGGIDELLKSIAVGRGRTEKLGDGLPTIKDATPWDGQDGKLPEEEDIDLSDIDMDDIRDEL